MEWKWLWGQRLWLILGNMSRNFCYINKRGWADNILPLSFFPFLPLLTVGFCHVNAIDPGGWYSVLLASRMVPVKSSISHYLAPCNKNSDGPTVQLYLKMSVSSSPFLVRALFYSTALRIWSSILRLEQLLKQRALTLLSGQATCVRCRSCDFLHPMTWLPTCTWLNGVSKNLSLPRFCECDFIWK